MKVTDDILKKASLKGLNDPEYIQKVWTLLEGMKPGDVITIKKITKEDTREDFIESVKLYMEETRVTYSNGLSFRHRYEELAKYDLDFTRGRKSTNNHVTL